MKIVPVAIPAYEPDNRLIVLLNLLEEEGLRNIVVINDGSGREFDHVFDEAKIVLERIDGVLLSHQFNLGKGKALKTAFEYILRNIPSAIGAVTADSDGQHSVQCIKSIQKVLEENSDSFILGVREFNGDGIPWKSKLGNKITEKIFKYLTGVTVSDTQTGLRGIPKSFMYNLLELKSNRFEFEMEMLLNSIGNYRLIQIPIETIYDSVDNHKTHFNPFKDSLRIYKVLIKKFIRYCFSSYFCSAIDIVLFYILCNSLRCISSAWYITIATIVARLVSATLNFTINYKMVFKSKEEVGRSLVKYSMLAIVQMLFSAFFTTYIVNICFGVNETIIKVVVDMSMFAISYYAQNNYVFRQKENM